MEVAVANDDAQITVSDALFGAEFKPALVHQVVTAYLAGARAGSKAQKTRAQVRGGGKKPWRQKGTGRARAGSIRSPLWKGGGVTFAAQPRDHGQKVNRKMYRGAMRSILAELQRQERLLVIPDLTLEARNTRALMAKLDRFGVTTDGRALIVVAEVDDLLAYSARNLSRLAVTGVAALNPAGLVGAEQVVITVDAL
ncbi:MAG: 50S ribosomal protein L4, partial [Salinisphaera sp.]|nr:50S ribosomal protein L4 [Salinisphaera sp.]